MSIISNDKTLSNNLNREKFGKYPKIFAKDLNCQNKNRFESLRNPVFSKTTNFETEKKERNFSNTTAHDKKTTNRSRIVDPRNITNRSKYSIPKNSTNRSKISDQSKNQIYSTLNENYESSENCTKKDIPSNTQYFRLLGKLQKSSIKQPNVPLYKTENSVFENNRRHKQNQKIKRLYSNEKSQEIPYEEKPKNNYSEMCKKTSNDMSFYSTDEKFSRNKYTNQSMIQSLNTKYKGNTTEVWKYQKTKSNDAINCTKENDLQTVKINPKNFFHLNVPIQKRKQFIDIIDDSQDKKEKPNRSKPRFVKENAGFVFNLCTINPFKQGNSKKNDSTKKLNKTFTPLTFGKFNKGNLQDAEYYNKKNKFKKQFYDKYYNRFWRCRYNSYSQNDEVSYSVNNSMDSVLDSSNQNIFINPNEIKNDSHHKRQISFSKTPDECFEDSLNQMSMPLIDYADPYLINLGQNFPKPHEPSLMERAEKLESSENIILDTSFKSLSKTASYSSRIFKYELLSENIEINKNSAWFTRTVQDINKHIKFLDIIGRGKNAIVYSCYLADDLLQEKMAVKIFEKKNNEDYIKKIQIMNEINLLSFLDHPNIIKLKHLYEDNNKVYLVLEYFGETYTTLKKYFAENNSKLPLRKIIAISKQIIFAIKHCHENNVCHLDINLSNILFNQIGTEIVLIDFGSACISDEYIVDLHEETTPAFMAPEIMKKYNKPINLKAIDIWAIGVLMYFQSLGELPFGDIFVNRIKMRVKNSDYIKLRSDMTQGVITSKIFKVLPTERPNIKQILDDLNFVKHKLVKRCFIDASKVFI